MSEGSGQQRYCGNCGAEIRSGMSFCVSCGAPVMPAAGGPGPTNPGPTPSDEPSPFDNLMAWLRQATERLRGTFSGHSTDDARRLSGRALGWFRDLPGISKLVLICLMLLPLLVLLSPVAAIIAALLFGVSIIALIIRVVQKGPIRNWGIVAVGSVVLMFTFGGISDALYGIGFVGSSGSGSEESGGTPGGSGLPSSIPDNGSSASPPASTGAVDYELFYNSVSNSGYSIPSTPGLDVLNLYVEADAHSLEDLEEVARTVLNDYSDPQYDVVEVGVVLPGEQSPMHRDVEVVATAPMTTHGVSVTGIPPGEFDIVTTD